MPWRSVQGCLLELSKLHAASSNVRPFDNIHRSLAVFKQPRFVSRKKLRIAGCSYLQLSRKWQCINSVCAKSTIKRTSCSYQRNVNVVEAKVFWRNTPTIIKETAQMVLMQCVHMQPSPYTNIYVVKHVSVSAVCLYYQQRSVLHSSTRQVLLCCRLSPDLWPVLTDLCVSVVPFCACGFVFFSQCDLSSGVFVNYVLWLRVRSVTMLAHSTRYTVCVVPNHV